MYDSPEAFRNDAEECGRMYYGDRSLNSQYITVAYAIYQKSRRGTNLGFSVVGRWPLSEGISSNEEFPSIDEAMKKNLLILNEDSTTESGSILYSEKWSLLANDAWLIGGIHANTDFHFASPLKETNLWDDKNKRISVTAREVIGLISFGYKIIRPQRKLEAVAICDDRNKAMTASLLAYNKKIQMYSTYDTLQQFFKFIPRESIE